MKNVIYDCTANVNFERFCFAVICRNSLDAPLVWVLCRGKTKPIPARIPLISTFKQHPIYRGIFTSAALPALSVGISQPPERTDERTLIDASRARCAISQDARKAGIKGVKSKATGFLIRAFADSEYLIQHRSNKTEQQTERDSGRGSPQTPALGSLLPEGT